MEKEMTGEISFIILCSMICVLGLLAICHTHSQIKKQESKDGKKGDSLLSQRFLSGTYKFTGFVGMGLLVLCLFMPEKAGSLQVTLALISLLVHFGLSFVNHPGLKSEACKSLIDQP